MADHLILSSLQPSPFTIFPCSLHRRWRFSGGVKFSVSEFRLSSSQLQLVKSTSSSSPEKFDLVSTTQLEDGSHIFRFGDASEIERNREIEAKVKKQHNKITGKVSDVSKKQGIKDSHTLVDSHFPKAKSDTKKESVDLDIETSLEKEESDAPAIISNVIKIKDRKRVRSSAKKKKDTSTSSVNVSRSEDEVASVSNLSSVVTVDETVPSTSTEEKVVVSEKSEPIIEDKVMVESDNVELLSSVVESDNVEPLSSVIESDKVEKSESIIENKVMVESDNVEPLSSMVESDKVEAKVASVSNLSSIVSVAEAIPNSTTEEKKVVSEKPELIIENVVTVESDNVEPLSSKVREKGSVNEIGDFEPNGYQQITETHMEVEERPRSSISKNGSQSEDLKEVNDNLNVRENPTKTIEAEENLVVEPTAVVSPDELISTSEATPRSVDEIAEPPVIDMSEMASEGENVASTIEEKLNVRHTEANNGSISETVSDTKDEELQLPVPEIADLQSMASGREEVVSKAFFLDSGLASLQSPSKALAGREDAYFISDHNWLGIADGVPQWTFEGINKGMCYAQELMSNCQKIISDETAEVADPVQVLHRSVNETKSPGSSTALIAHLDNNELHIANIGDSGFMVIRKGTVLQRSSPMFHHFYFPLHITQGDDVQKLAEVYNVNLDEGDVVITATDGLFDNLYEKEIVSIVCRSLEQSLEPQKIAELVAAKAQEVGRSGTEKTPFADAAKEEGYHGHKGGKLDAVTVIISLVKTVSI